MIRQYLARTTLEICLDIDGYGSQCLSLIFIRSKKFHFTGFISLEQCK